MKRGLCVIGAGLVLAACGASEPDGRDAYEACENWVEDQLRTPSTADFSGFGGSEVTNSGPDYIVRGHVDAENGFGANIRSDFSCQMKLTGDSWHLVDLDLDL